MKFADLSKQDIFYIRKTHSENSIPWDQRMGMLMDRFNKSERTIRRWIKKLGFSSTHLDDDPDQIKVAKSRKIGDSKYHIISWAQNATPVHGSFFNNMLTYAEFIGAEVHIIPGRYKNPTSVFSDKNFDWWEESLTPYLTLGRLNIHQSVSILGDIKVQPTATNPLFGFEGLTGSSSTIVGHPRVHMLPLPVLDGYPHKFMFTTGGVTMPNYTDSRAGKTAEFHHTYGFIILEIKDKNVCFIRNVTATTDGSFCDLLYEVSDGAVRVMDSVEAFVMGDLHASAIDAPLFESTKKYLQILKPKQIVLHDVFDGHSISHHERKDPIKNFLKMQSGKHLVAAEVEETFGVIESLLEYNPIIVNSNHDRWLDRWVVDQDWKKELHNSLAYMNYANILLSGKAPNGLLPYLAVEKFGDRVKCLNVNDSYRICGWEVANHGDKGANGSKGNIEQFRKMSTKVILGDWHKATRKDGALSVGTHSKLRAGFNDGPSSWNNADIIIHKNEKAQHVIFFNNEFTTLLDGLSNKHNP